MSIHVLVASKSTNFWDNLEEMFAEPLSEDWHDDNEEEEMVKPEDQLACATADEPMAGHLGVLLPNKKTQEGD